MNGFCNLEARKSFWEVTNSLSFCVEKRVWFHQLVVRDNLTVTVRAGSRLPKLSKMLITWLLRVGYCWLFNISYDKIWFDFIIFNLNFGKVISQNCLKRGTIFKWVWQIFHKRNQNYNLIFFANWSCCKHIWWRSIFDWTASNVISFRNFILGKLKFQILTDTMKF